MNILKLLQQRKSVRAFLDKEVETEKINAILSAASHAPSGANIQPWQVAVVGGETKKELQTQIENSFRQGVRGEADYQYYPKKWIRPYKFRRINCGKLMYTTLNIKRSDKQRRLDQWAANYRAFDAPVLLLFFMDASMEAGSFLDCGMFLQSIMLAALEQGLATCPQAAFSDYPAIIKKTLGYPQNSILLCGMAIGYEDKDALVNSYRTPREDISTFTRYFT
ncbi:MAG TPA: nitroreductase [Desulfobacterales bacterium]|nr:nitroreductase [Desulfobacterales bacterium]HIP39886.1 nitroreductase [Desulfocapsa sulfexigens]